MAYPIQAMDVLTVRYCGYIPGLIRRHCGRFYGKTYTNHNVTIATSSQCLYAVQVAPPVTTVVPLEEYLDWMEKNGHQWHCWRMWWLENERIGHGYWGEAAKDYWKKECSEYALSLRGKPYPKIDIIRLALEDITRGWYRAKNCRFDYCTESFVNSIKHGWHTVPPVFLDTFPVPWHIEQAARLGELVSVCGNQSWIREKILL